MDPSIIYIHYYIYGRVHFEILVVFFLFYSNFLYFYSFLMYVLVFYLKSTSLIRGFRQEPSDLGLHFFPNDSKTHSRAEWVNSTRVFIFTRTLIILIHTFNELIHCVLLKGYRQTKLTQSRGLLIRVYIVCLKETKSKFSKKS